MTETLLSAQEFDADIGSAKKAAEAGPVIITDHGQPAYVLLRHDAYARMASRPKSLAERLVMEDGDDIEFDPPRAVFGFKPAAFD